MSPKQYRDTLKRLGLNLNTGANFLGVSYRTSRRMGSDGESAVPVPRSVAMLLRMAVRYRLAPEIVADEFGD